MRNTIITKQISNVSGIGLITHIYSNHHGKSNVETLQISSQYSNHLGMQPHTTLHCAHAHAHRQTHTLTHTHTYIHTQTHTPTHTQTYTQTHTYTHTTGYNIHLVQIPTQLAYFMTH